MKLDKQLRQKLERQKYLADRKLNQNYIFRPAPGLPDPFVGLGSEPTGTLFSASTVPHLGIYIDAQVHSTIRAIHQGATPRNNNNVHFIMRSSVGVEILWEEEGFQFGLKRWQGWAVSNVLWEWSSNVGSKARERTKAMSLAFVFLDFQHAGVRRRA